MLKTVYNKDMTEIKPKRKPRGENYVNNKDFSQAVSEYAENVAADIAAGKEPRRLTDYIGECLLKIANGLSHSPNFVNYSYREDMVMDAVENCVKAVIKFDREAFETRKAKVTELFEDGLDLDDLQSLGKEHGSPIKNVQRWYKEWASGEIKTPQKGMPNAFSYFTQISWFAFLRRIAKEKKQTDIKKKLIDSGNISNFAKFDDDDFETGESMVEKLRQKNDAFYKECDVQIKEQSRLSARKRAKRVLSVRGALDNFIA